MQIIVGLGNPGKKYEQTRHNVGWLALDYVLKKFDAPGAEQKKFDAVIREVRTAAGDKALFVYPQTFMNDSGKSVAEILNFYKLSPATLLVLHDEVDLPLGVLRFTENSSSAGHNGVQSIIDALGTNEFRRLRIGIETRTDKTIPTTYDFVLQEFPADELAKIPFDAIEARVLLELRPKK